MTERHPRSLLEYIAMKIKSGEISSEPPQTVPQPSLESRLQQATQKPSWQKAVEERIRSAAETPASPQIPVARTPGADPSPTIENQKGKVRRIPA